MEELGNNKRSLEDHLGARSIEESELARKACIGGSPSGVYEGPPVPQWLHMHGPCGGTLVYNPCAPGGPLYTPLGDSPIQLVLAMRGLVERRGVPTCFVTLA